MVEEKSNSFILPLSILLTALIVSAVFLFSMNGVNSKLDTLTAKIVLLEGKDTGAQAGDAVKPAEPSNGGNNNPAQPTGNLADDDAVRGAADAKVTIVEFSDYQCPYCGKAEPTVEQILKDYDGKVKLVFRDFPLSFHQYAQKASEASECAGEQGKFWEMHDMLFANQSNLTDAELKKYAADLGLDTAKFNSCLDSGAMASEVQKDFEDGQAAGVSGTPSFFINGQILVGAQPISEFKKIIDAELAK
ncbi:MAG: DsbA family protein [Candidatus Diapherotrites archaeon]